MKTTNQQFFEIGLRAETEKETPAWKNSESYFFGYTRGLLIRAVMGDATEKSFAKSECKRIIEIGKKTQEKMGIKNA